MPTRSSCTPLFVIRAPAVVVVVAVEFHQLLPVTRCQPVDALSARSSSARAVHLLGVHAEVFPAPSAARTA